MIALIKNDRRGLEIIAEPIPEWVDPIAFSVFDCYGYSLCENYIEKEGPQFEFSTREIPNPYRETEEDPETITQRLARMIE